jgi:hypothetical protein
MAIQSFQRPLVTQASIFDATVTPGFITEDNADKFYLPIMYDNFTIPNLTPVVNTTTGQARLNAVTAGDFDNVRVGDIVSSLSAGALTAKATIDRSCYAVKGQFYVVYPVTFTSSTLGVKVGDAVTGATANVIPANTVVDKIDYATRRIFLSNAVGTAGDIIDVLTFTPPVRVTAVRPSTATTNANQIDIDSTIATGANGATATIKGGAREAISHVLRIEPVDTTVGSRVAYQISVSILAGTAVVGSASGNSDIDFTTLAYVTVGTYNFDADVFLLAARLPRPVS